MVSGTLTNGSGVSYATTNDIASFATTSSVSTLSTALSTLQTSVGTNSGSLASKADSSSIYTQNHIDTNFQTVAPSGETFAFVSAIPDVSGFITAAAISTNHYTKTETDALIPDVSSFITTSTSSLTNYDTSSTVDTKISNASGGSSAFDTSGNKVYKSASNAFLGLGHSNPIVPLDIRNHGGGWNDAGYVYTPSSSKVIMWWNYGTSLASRSSTAHYNFIGAFIANKLVVSDMIISTSGVIQGSDARIKKNIEDVSDDVCLKKLRELRPKTYNYIDTTQRTSSEVYGFIAQEVREVFPEATQIGTNTIPNIMDVGLVSEGNVITFDSFDTSSLTRKDAVLECLDSDATTHFFKVKEVIDDKSLRVENDLSEISCLTEEGRHGKYINIRGERVDDFVHLNKDAIWTVATSALQEVDRKVTALEARISALEKK
jgi:hypothetical protein